MWVQLDYAYFVAAIANGAIAASRGFVFVDPAPAGVGIASVLVSLARGGVSIAMRPTLSVCIWRSDSRLRYVPVETAANDAAVRVHHAIDTSPTSGTQWPSARFF